MALMISSRRSVYGRRTRTATALPPAEPVLILSAIVLALFCLLAAGMARTAHAQDKSVAVARGHWERGTKFYDLGKYDDAIREFEAAYEAKSDPAFLYNLAQSHRLAGHSADALRSYRTYLRYVPKAPNRPDIENHIKELERAVAERPNAETVTTPPASATTPPPATTTPPTNTAPPPSTTTTVPPVSPAPPAAVWPTPNVPPADVSQNGGLVPAPGQGNFPAPNAAGDPGAGRRKAGVVLAASGGGLFVVGAIFGIVTRNQSKKVEDAASNGERFDPGVESLGKTAQALQWVGYGLGIAGIAAGVILYATAPKVMESSTLGPVAIAPMLGPNGGGAMLGVKF